MKLNKFKQGVDITSWLEIIGMEQRIVKRIFKLQDLNHATVVPTRLENSYGKLISNKECKLYQMSEMKHI